VTGSKRTPSEEELAGPPGPWSRLHMMLRFLYIILAAIPTTTVPPMLLTALFYRRFGSEERFQRIHSVLGWARFCSRRILQMDVRIEGRERLPADRGRLMFVSNHQSYVDIPMIMGALGIGAFLSKRLVAYLPVIGQIAWLAGTVYFDRRSEASRKRALEDVLRMCERSTPVALFPEGTRSRDGNLREKVHLGAIAACWERGIRVATFAFHGTRYVYPPTMDRFNGHQRVAIVVGDTLDPRDHPSADAFAVAAWREVGRRFAEAREMHGSPEWEGYPPA
jgi:1-acyl-sn-glycerol-3-phosphate acyltransferase